MKSSSQELYEAVMELTRYDDGQSYGNLAVVSEFSKRISDSFNDVNNSLSEGWETTASFAKKIQAKILEELNGLYTELSKFTAETIEGETTAKVAADEANKTADSILSELGLDTAE